MTNKFTKTFFLLSLFISVTFQFQAVDNMALQHENFILKYYLSDKDYNDYPNVLSKTFKLLFNMDLPTNENVPKLLEFIMLANETAFSSRFATEEQVSPQALFDSLKLIVLDNSDSLQQVYSTVRPKNLDMTSFKDQIAEFLKEFVIYHIQVAIINQSSSDYIKSIIFSDQIIQGLTQTMKNLNKVTQNTFDENAFKNDLNELVNDNIYTKLNSYAQFFEFRESGIEGIYDFAMRIMTGLKQGTIIWNDSSIDKFIDLMLSTMHLNIKVHNLDSHVFIANFAIKGVIPNRIMLGEANFVNLMTNIMNLFTIEINNYVYQQGRLVLLTFLFPNENYYSPRHRTFLLKSIYKRKGIKIDYNQNNYPFISHLNMLYIVDLLRCTNDNDLILSNSDFSAVMKAFTSFLNFDVSKANLMDNADKFFNVSNQAITNNIEIYHALYNSIVSFAFEWKNNHKTDNNSFIIAYETFIANAYGGEFDISEFDFHIQTYYIVFKMVNLTYNRDFFKQYNNQFHSFDKNIDQNLINFMNGLPEATNLMNEWKNRSGSKDKNKFFNYGMLSGVLIESKQINAFNKKVQTQNPDLLFI